MFNRSSFTSHLPYTHTHTSSRPSKHCNRYPDYPQRRALIMTLRCRDEEEENGLWGGDRMRTSESQSRKGVCKHFHKVIEDAAWMLGMLLSPNKGTKQRGRQEVAVEFITYSGERKKKTCLRMWGKLWAYLSLCVCVCELRVTTHVNLLWIKPEDQPLNCYVQNILAFKTSDNFLEATMYRI